MGAATAAAAMRVWGANNRVSVALVGIGGRGSGHLNIYSRLPEARVVGLCDVNQAARERAQATLLKNTGEKAKEYEDMRDAFADSNVEAVSIATPNHWHALAAIWAMKAGKDVYGEKPASYNIYEGQKLVQVARETKRMLQMEWAMSMDQAIEAEAVAQALCMTTNDFRRAYDAFVAKQRPVFRGD